MNYYYPYRQDWSSVVQYLNYSLNGEQMVCSMTSQLFHIPETENLEGNAEMHNHLVPASYHRVTALGCANRLQSGEDHESIIKTLIACVQNGLKEDEEITKWLTVMKENAPNNYKGFMDSVIGWQQQTEQSLAIVQQLLGQMGLDMEVENELY
ncbi:hypothetical protein GMD78_10675 [Ornithinibacillus sp. L9]|uniref:Uncharacterized protein n=1 Tax=Ornithinibacillus caprae TaxID=2678566 RepID=A0A6N8FJJ0_9BACI|nr:hypothetical protein [Ornithinibacillus caprae]MUK88856.1 hypothetical protein [Ornithinibacillus caprae]